MADSVKMGARVRRVVDVLRDGGHARHKLETDYFGRDKFKTRVLDKNWAVVPGLGYRAVHDALDLGLLARVDVPSTSAYETRWVLNKEAAA